MTEEQRNILESLSTLAEVSRSMSDAGSKILCMHPCQMNTALTILNRKIAALQEYTMRVFLAEEREG